MTYQLFQSTSVLIISDYQVVLTRFLCAILLHIQLEADVRQGIAMLKYYNNHSGDFVGRGNEPAVVATMQLIGALFAETVNIVLICSQLTVIDSVLNFIALGVITEIDNYYYNALPNNELKNSVSDPLPVTNHSK